jgi:hypothetical protein
VTSSIVTSDADFMQIALLFIVAKQGMSTIKNPSPEIIKKPLKSIITDYNAGATRRTLRRLCRADRAAMRTRDAVRPVTAIGHSDKSRVRT